MPLYKIVRFFSRHDSIIIKTFLTREEAVAHCSDIETSSMTCKLPVNKRLTKHKGKWFDGFKEHEIDDDWMANFTSERGVPTYQKQSQFEKLVVAFIQKNGIILSKHCGSSTTDRIKMLAFCLFGSSNRLFSINVYFHGLDYLEDQISTLTSSQSEEFKSEDELLTIVSTAKAIYSTLRTTPIPKDNNHVLQD